MTKIYNKLVRDNIPEIILNSGKTIQFKIVKGKDFEDALKRKLIEEAKELLDAKTMEEQIEEIGDIWVVLNYIIDTLNISRETVVEKCEAKGEDKGGFEKGYFLESVKD